MILDHATRRETLSALKVIWPPTLIGTLMAPEVFFPDSEPFLPENEPPA